jgi:uncharacterized repeat protein (TIGR03803 family)
MPGKNPQTASAKLASISLFVLAVILTQPAQAQTFTVLYNFTGGADGSTPKTGLSMDGAGNLYGTTYTGGETGNNCAINFLTTSGCGTVFRLAHSGSGWTFDSLYKFTGRSDGAPPSSRVVFGPDGALYGTATYGGDASCNPGFYGCGLVYRLNPQPTFCRNVLCPWVQTSAFTFQHYPSQGQFPSGDLIFDAQGNLYGTTIFGGNNSCGDGEGCGTVFELTRSGGSWAESVLYAFTIPLAYPSWGVIADHSGNLYGNLTGYGGGFDGAVFQLTPSGSGWTENTLYEFDNNQDGYDVQAGLVIDQQGYLVGGTEYGGQSNFGTIFQLNPLPNGTWNLNTIYNFQLAAGGPEANLTMDSAGNLYGTAYSDGAHAFGSVFKLTPTDQGWVYTDFHDFNRSDGANPISSVLVDAQGNLYGTTSAGGAYGYGVVWEITP